MTTLKEVLSELIEENMDAVPEVFWELPVVFEGSWSDYEENAWQVIFKFFDELFLVEYRYCVISDDNSFHFDPIPISLEDFEELKQDWKSDERNSWQEYE